MNDLFFLQYLFFLGLFFGLIFRNKIPLVFIILSSFIWGMVLFVLALLVINIFGLRESKELVLIISCVLILLPVIISILYNKTKLKLNEISLIIFSCISFFGLNLLFHTFNFSLASIDSFALVMLGRTIAYEGFSQSVINSFTSWGVLIPLLHSMSIFLNIDYLVTLEFSIGVTLFSLFVYFCERICFELFPDKKISYLITTFLCAIFISTPMFIIQLFYIHTNLAAACFFLIAIMSCWYYFQEKEISWLIFFLLSLFGLGFSRSETFIYGILLILFFVSFIQTKNNISILVSFTFLIPLTAWLIYIYSGISAGTDIFDKNRIMIIILGLILFMCSILMLQIKSVSQFLKPLINKWFLLPFFLINAIMLEINFTNMMESNQAVISNLFISGYWGVIFWLGSLYLLLMNVRKRTPFQDYLEKISIAISLMIIAMGFFRVPYRLSWNDSANRLVTMVFPIILLLFATLVFTFRISRKDNKIENGL